MLEHRVIELHNTFLSSVMKIFHSACGVETIDSTHTSFVHVFAFCTKQ